MSPEVLSSSSKVTSQQLQHLAYVYVRQSTLKQVEVNIESRENQYRLVERAHALGWSRDRIRVIDTDTGQSAKNSGERSGFHELLAEVSLGHVGIILGYEVSRLARNNSDWYRLLDLAAVFDTLIADIDGVYDPRHYNDRLLLGLKGTMSEAELHVLRMRLHAGRLNKVQRGGYRQCLPTGLVWLEDDSVVKDPDEQVRSVIELVFTKFEEIGSCRGVARYMRQEKILLPRRHQGMGHGKLRWKVASDHMIWDMLNNPAYAGAFAYGRTQFDPKHRKTGHPSSGRLDKTAKEWTCLHKGAYPAYITWEQYESNQERIRNNGSRVVEAKLKAVGTVREGAGLLQGLVTCGQCGRRMTTVYKPHPKYCCQALGRSGEPLCSYIPATAIDDVVVAAYFQAIRPAELNALEAVLKTQQAERDRLIKHWEQQLKRAKYEVDLAERQYDAVDATHRLVALTLEQRWEEKLNQLRTTQEDYERFMNTPSEHTLTPEQCEQFRNISEALPTLWRANRLTHAHQKDLLRALIARVNLKRVAPDQIEVNIIWVSGHYTLLQTTVPIHRNEEVTGMSTVLQRIHELCEQDIADEQIAEQLTQEGFRSARSTTISKQFVFKARLKNRWFRPREALQRAGRLNGKWTTGGLARHLGTTTRQIFHRLHNGTIDVHHIYHDPNTGSILIDDYPGLLDALNQSGLGKTTVIPNEVV